jgi:hypothetical protein
MRLRTAVLLSAVTLLQACVAVPPAPVEVPEPEPMQMTSEEISETPEVSVNVPMPAKAPPVTSSEVAPEGRTNELISYLAYVARASAPVQKKELASATAAFGRASTFHTRLRLGGLYAQPVPGLRDDARALALLEPLATTTAANPAERPVVDLAALLYAQVAERLRLSKDDAKKQDDLRERIEAMKSIERSIMQREERQGAR